MQRTRDGAPGAPVVLRSRARGKAVVRPPAGSNAFVITHDHHVVDGFKIKDAAQGIRLGPHEVADGPVTGFLGRRSRVIGSSSNGISVVNGVDVEIALNQVKRSGANGISCSGGASRIDDNVVHHNLQFGIYVRDGVDHRVYDNEAYANGTGDDDNVKILGATAPTPAQTYFVGCENGDDARTPTKAKKRETPWKSNKGALEIADAGDTVRVLPGVCRERSIESRRNGRRKAPITIEAETRRTVTIVPPTGNGLLIVHHHHTVRGLVVTGVTNGSRSGRTRSAAGW